jgi:hypothetical protein
MMESDADDMACYAIRISGRLGPLLLCSLQRKGVVRLESAGRTSTLIRVVDADIVDVAERVADRGMEIESVREVTSRPFGRPAA